MFVKPGPNRRVRYPESDRLLPETGAEIPLSTYWVRRLNCGDVVVFDVPIEPVVMLKQIPDSKGEV